MAIMRWPCMLACGERCGALTEIMVAELSNTLMPCHRQMILYIYLSTTKLSKMIINSINTHPPPSHFYSSYSAFLTPIDQAFQVSLHHAHWSSQLHQRISHTSCAVGESILSLGCHIKSWLGELPHTIQHSQVCGTANLGLQFFPDSKVLKWIALLRGNYLFFSPWCDLRVVGCKAPPDFLQGFVWFVGGTSFLLQFFSSGKVGVGFVGW